MTKRHHEMTDTTDSIYYHYTTREALKSILTEGLLPFPVQCWRECWCERWDDNGIMYIDGFPPDFLVVWLTKLVLDSTPTRDVRIKIELSPNRKRLVHLPKWLKRHAPDMFAKLDADILFTGWLQHYWYKGIIMPDKFRGIDAIRRMDAAGRGEGIIDRDEDDWKNHQALDLGEEMKSMSGLKKTSRPKSKNRF